MTHLHDNETPPDFEHCPYCGSTLNAQHQCMSGVNHYLDEYWEQA
ncbi:hypothetical protein [Bifidobacterium psychraerophilum]